MPGAGWSSEGISEADREVPAAGCEGVAPSPEARHEACQPVSLASPGLSQCEEICFFNVLLCVSLTHAAIVCDVVPPGNILSER